ncbi:MAG: hypothetical protein ABIN35_04485 [candidate division WOR-3 bacterium]
MGIKVLNLIKKILTLMRKTYPINERELKINKIRELESSICSKLSLNYNLNLDDWDNEELDSYQKNLEKINETIVKFEHLVDIEHNIGSEGIKSFFIEKLKQLNNVLKIKFENYSNEKMNFLKHLNLVVEDYTREYEEFKNEMDNYNFYQKFKNVSFNNLKKIIEKFSEFYENIDTNNYDENKTDKLLTKMLESNIERMEETASFQMGLRKNTMSTFKTRIIRIDETLEVTNRNLTILINRLGIDKPNKNNNQQYGDGA